MGEYEKNEAIQTYILNNDELFDEPARRTFPKDGYNEYLLEAQLEEEGGNHGK